MTTRGLKIGRDVFIGDTHGIIYASKLFQNIPANNKVKTGIEGMIKRI